MFAPSNTADESIIRNCSVGSDMKSRTHNLTVTGVLMLVMAFCASGLARVADDEDPSEVDITRATASLLDREPFSPRPLDAWFSGRFLDQFLNALDGMHHLFLQCDLAEFDRFRPDLALLTLREGETRPAHIIYARYLKRLAQQVNFETNLLHYEKFDFTGHDSGQADRNDEPPPRDLAAAEDLWRTKVREDYLREKLAATPTEEIAPILAHRYEGLWQTMRRLNTNQVLEIYLDTLAHVYDPHSDYFGREEWENFNIGMKLSLGGIGGTLQIQGGYSVISYLVPGGPAARSRLLKSGDRIVSVAQGNSEPVYVMGMPPTQVVELIRGLKGSTVRLTIIPAGAGDPARETVSLVRDEVKLADEHAKAAIIDLPQTGKTALRVGVIDLPSFYGTGGEIAEGSSADTARLIKKLKQEGVRGLILDLRRNGGGSLEEAIHLTGLFIPSGPVVQTWIPEGDVEIGTSPESSAIYDGPLVVLTSRLSASASEIVAGALQDYGRALIVGDSSTFGKGTVQTIVPLKALLHHRGLGAVKLTICKFYRPSGASTQLKGVVSDIVLPSETDLPDIGESRLPNALSWNLMPTTTFAKFDSLPPVLAMLREKSLARVSSDPAFGLVGEELAMAEKQEEAKSISLNEAERRHEKAQADQIKVEMNKFLLAKAARRPPTYDITLANVDSAGLPPSRAPASSVVTAEPLEHNPDVDIELSETENILADYIHTLPPCPKGVIVAESARWDRRMRSQ
jgi:carboxyl-terminal processing protease